MVSLIEQSLTNGGHEARRLQLQGPAAARRSAWIYGKTIKTLLLLEGDKPAPQADCTNSTADKLDEEPGVAALEPRQSPRRLPGGQFDLHFRRSVDETEYGSSISRARANWTAMGNTQNGESSSNGAGFSLLNGRSGSDMLYSVFAQISSNAYWC
jgi:hypothetical protein